MAYSGSKFPIERASKIAHMELIQDQALIELLQADWNTTHLEFAIHMAELLLVRRRVGRARAQHRAERAMRMRDRDEARARELDVGRPAPHAFGHFGAGGSGAWADPERELGVAVVTNCLGGLIPGDLRPVALATATSRCADRR